MSSYLETVLWLHSKLQRSIIIIIIYGLYKTILVIKIMSDEKPTLRKFFKKWGHPWNYNEKVEILSDKKMKKIIPVRVLTINRANLVWLHRTPNKNDRKMFASVNLTKFEYLSPCSAIQLLASLLPPRPRASPCKWFLILLRLFAPKIELISRFHEPVLYHPRESKCTHEYLMYHFWNLDLSRTLGTSSKRFDWQ